MKTKLLTLACLSGLALTGSAMAQSWTEQADAGQMPGTAQVVTGSGLLTTINGSVSTYTDADMYLINISNPAIFSATTNINPGTLTDTTLYLFNLNGTGIAKNDDISGSNFLSALPIGDSKYTALTPGLYLLAVGGYGYCPVWNSPPQVLGDLVFDANTFVGVLGPQPGAGAVVDWADLATYDQGSYTISLTGASTVPAPGPIALVAAGGIVAIRRRRSN